MKIILIILTSFTIYGSSSIAATPKICKDILADVGSSGSKTKLVSYNQKDAWQVSEETVLRSGV